MNMKTSPKRLTKAEIKKHMDDWSHDLSRYTGLSDDGTGGKAVEGLIRHIAYLEMQIKLLTLEDSDKSA